MIRHRLLKVFYSLLLAIPLSAAHTPSFEESLSLRAAGTPKVSPDGHFVVWSVSQADWKQNSYVSHLWLADARSGRAWQLTRGKKSS
ncbi:MAG TPA: hypothetical protein VKB56_03915, partial [Terriglobales bacterium]|nr:hypothetical protein [Terriglobales bacterium]